MARVTVESEYNRLAASVCGWLSNILRTFNDQFGNIEWTDADRVQRFITEEIPRKVAEDEAYQNAQKNNDLADARKSA
ncbi:MAG: hypothetical protein ACRDMV_05180 [Streptosporangiales bacterium]